MRLAQDKPIMMRGKMVGVIKTNRTYISHRNKNHYFRKYFGFGISASILADLRKYEVKQVIIIYNKIDGTQELWTATVKDFYEHGTIYKDIGVDYQRILNRRYWVIK